MLGGRTAWAIAVLLAPTGVAAAGSMAIGVPAGHAAYVEFEVDPGRESPDLATVNARVACGEGDLLSEAADWLDGSDCSAPAGAAVYVTRADAPSPAEADLEPTGEVYEYRDGDRLWRVSEYTYGDEDAPRMAYVLTPDLADRVVEEGRGEPVRGVVNLTRMGVAPGQTVQLETTLGPGPQASPEDPVVHRVTDAGANRPTLG